MSDRTPTDPEHRRNARPARASSGVRHRVWGAEHEGHQIRVVRVWMTRAQLFIDGRLVDSRTHLLSIDPAMPILTARLDAAGRGAVLVEVFIDGPWLREVRLRVGGRAVDCAREFPP